MGSGRLLGVDTSNAACAVGLWIDGDCLERYRVAPREQGNLLLPMVEALLAEAGIALAELDALVLGRGPGAFTGLRIAAGVVQGLAFAADRPVVPVSSLAALAQTALGRAEPACRRVYAAFDARMGEVYWGAYAAGDEGRVSLLGDEQVAAPQAVVWPAGRVDDVSIAVGEGWQQHRQALLDAIPTGSAPPCLLAEPLYPRAAALLELGAAAWAAGAAISAAEAVPVYLRDQVVAVRPSRRPGNGSRITDRAGAQ